MAEHVARRAAQKEFAESGMPVESHNEQVLISALGIIEKGISDGKTDLGDGIDLGLNAVPGERCQEFDP